jgi:hypothetical protein
VSDTKTTLNPGTGGDDMDESLVIQSDGVTAAKRPRVVMGLDDGRLIHLGNALPVTDPDVVGVLKEIRDDMRVIRLLLEGITN